MKSERRHRLERNELADRLGTGVAAVQPILPFVLGGLAILAVGSIAWGIFSSNAKQREAVAWTDFYFNLTGGDAEDFMDVADEYPKSTASGWARQTAGDSYLAQGINLLYENRAEGEEKIQLAIEAFEDVLQGSPDDTLRSKALIGLGQAQESLGKLDEAIGNYQQVLASTSLPTRVLAAVSDRVSFLTSDSGKEFYDWFSELDPKPDAAIDLGDLTVPKSLEQDPLEFGDLPDTTGADSPVMPELDLDDIGLPDIGTQPESGTSDVNDLTVPGAEPSNSETSNSTTGDTEPDGNGTPDPPAPVVEIPISDDTGAENADATTSDDR